MTDAPKSPVILQLSETQVVKCDDIESAKALWAREHSDNLVAEIDVYPPAGQAGAMASYRYDQDLEDWVRSD